MKFRERLARFMYGRNGIDPLGRALLWLYLILAIVALFFEPMHLFVFAVMVWMFFRIFSKNIVKRQKENAIYLRLAAKPKNWIRVQRNRFRDRKTHCYKKCPYCKVTLRLPKKRGKHTVCCPKCRKDFEVKI